MIWAIVLAAGKSERMGRPKMLLPFGRRTLIEKVVSGLTRTRVEGIIVVLGAWRNEIETRLRTFPVKTVPNPDFEAGMLSSVQAGFAALPAEAGGALVVLGDQPSIPASVIDRIIGEFERSPKGIIIPVYRGRRGHPVLIARKYGREIMILDRKVGLRQLVARHPEEVREVPVRTSKILKDIDVPEDYRAALQEACRKKAPGFSPRGVSAR